MITVDAEKLSETIQRFLAETNGACVSTGACIGVVGRKQIQLHVVSDPDDFSKVDKQWECVKARKP